MKKIKFMIFLTTFGMSSFSFANYYGYEQYPQYSYEVTNPEYGSYSGYSPYSYSYPYGSQYGQYYQQPYSQYYQQPYSQYQQPYYSQGWQYSQTSGQPGQQAWGYHQQGGVAQGVGDQRSIDVQTNQRNSIKDSEEKKNGWSNWFGHSDKAPIIPDEVLSTRVIQNLRSTPYFSNEAKNIQVVTKDGKVTLKGRVANSNEKNQIEYMVKGIEGVKSVSLDLETEK